MGNVGLGQILLVVVVALLLFGNFPKRRKDLTKGGINAAKEIQSAVEDHTKQKERKDGKPTSTEGQEEEGKGVTKVGSKRKGPKSRYTGIGTGKRRYSTVKARRLNVRLPNVAYGSDPLLVWTKEKPLWHLEWYP